MAKVSISICKGRGCIGHNNRDFITENVDKDKVKNNVVYVAEPLSVAYEKCFGKAIKEYNEKQTRADRRIDGAKGYMEQIKRSGNGEKLFYEDVVQVGNMQDSHVGTPQGELCAKVLDEYMRDFQKRNPNLYVFNAVLHMDEQTPHLHIDYIPLAHGYKQGLLVRNSLDKAFREQGFDGKANKFENRTVAWHRAEKDRIEEVMQQYGLERAEEQGLKRSHMTVAQYKAVVEVVNNQVANIPKQIESTPSLIKKDRVSVRKEDLEQLEQRAKLSMEHEKVTKELVAELHQDRKDVLKEKEMLEEIRAKYEHLYSSQKNINEVVNIQKKTIEKLELENRFLKAENKDLDNDLSKALQRIRNIESRLQRMCQYLVDVFKAFGMLKYDKREYGVKLNEVQSRLFDAIEKCVTRWLRNERQDDLANKVEQYVGISAEIQKEVEDLKPRSMSNDMELGE